MKTRSELIETLRALKPELERRFGVSAISIFGSAAREETGAGSDVDLLVDFARTPSLFLLADLDAALERALGAKVDVVPRTSLHPAMRADVERDLAVV